MRGIGWGDFWVVDVYHLFGCSSFFVLWGLVGCLVWRFLRFFYELV